MYEDHQDCACIHKKSCWHGDVCSNMHDYTEGKPSCWLEKVGMTHANVKISSHHVEEAPVETEEVKDIQPQPPLQSQSQPQPLPSVSPASSARKYFGKKKNLKSRPAKEH